MRRPDDTTRLRLHNLLQDHRDLYAPPLSPPPSQPRPGIARDPRRQGERSTSPSLDPRHVETYTTVLRLRNSNRQHHQRFSASVQRWAAGAPCEAPTPISSSARPASPATPQNLRLNCRRSSHHAENGIFEHLTIHMSLPCRNNSQTERPGITRRNERATTIRCGLCFACDCVLDGHQARLMPPTQSPRSARKRRCRVLRLAGRTIPTAVGKAIITTFIGLCRGPLVANPSSPSPNRS
jgi:hypothetical protein